MTTVLAAEYASARDVVAATTAIRQTAVEIVETYLPHAIDELAPERRAPVALLAAAAGIGGAAAAYVGQWWIAAYLYPIESGARPPHMPLAFAPIAVEMGFLAAAVAAIIAWFFGARLGALWAPICDVPGFASTGYWLVVRGGSADELRALLARTGAIRIEPVPRRGAAP